MGTSPKNEYPVLNRKIMIKNTNSVAIEAKINKIILMLRSLSFSFLGANL
jgi:hypothetical protein